MERSSDVERNLPAPVVIPCGDPEAAAEFLTGELGFRIDSVFPADDPSVVEVSGHGLRLQLARGFDPAAGPPRPPADPRLGLPPLRPSFALTSVTDGPGWHRGRAGMEYRDLIPDRQGGWFIASHIRIPGGGPVPDNVHFHRIRFQMIYCHRGWVRVVYEDQGPPFVLQAGDSVLQPPEIRHRVLEASPGLEVIEVTCPAEHDTRLDHELDLPTSRQSPEREFRGQRFVRHVAAGADWTLGPTPGFEFRDLGMAAATGGLAGARVIRPCAEGASRPIDAHQGEFLFRFVLRGKLQLRLEGSPPRPLVEGDAVVVPAGMRYALADWSPDLEWLEVRLPS